MTFSITAAAKQAKKAARQVANLTSKQKNQLLADIAESLLANTAAILVANEKDLSAGKENGLDAAMLDRLALDPARIQDIANAVYDSNLNKYYEISTYFVPNQCGILAVDYKEISNFVPHECVNEFIENKLLEKLILQADQVWLGSAWNEWTPIVPNIE